MNYYNNILVYNKLNNSTKSTLLVRVIAGVRSLIACNTILSSLLQTEFLM